ncbi:hypothetical protein PoB_003598400 [Plakobranchus ocellatus]|uniref:Uncharacterized protein n=1 Tax=Plakobranchus ocellatus TaxID=259542 RepID=A0AAV4ATN4_9GAST|nr:hypothetical protein PoB_003598400 [Plakobranchus ocellatus]
MYVPVFANGLATTISAMLCSPASLSNSLVKLVCVFHLSASLFAASHPVLHTWLLRMILIFLCIARPQCDLRLSSTPSDQSADDGTRTSVRRAPAHLRMDSLSSVPLMPPPPPSRPYYEIFTLYNTIFHCSPVSTQP